MNIGIIVHSKTGNTYSVAQKFREELMESGHTVTVEKVIAESEDQADAQKIKLTAIPKIDAYNVLIFGAPVRGFSLSPIMEAYLTQVSSLKGKKVCCFMTQFLPFTWMGGDRALKRMKELCEAKGATICGSSIINWNKSRDKKIEDTVFGFRQSLTKR